MSAADGASPNAGEAAAADRRLWLIGVPIAVLALGAIELAEGRVPWCKCGSWVPWSFDIWSMHNSQHLVDPYSGTHILHGVAFCGIAWLLLSRWVPFEGRLVLASVAEAAWELVENSDWIINKYRAATISLDYFGDSVANSMSDVVMCALGFAIAHRIGWKGSLALFAAMELLLLATIRDGLILNILMLIHPVDAIKAWQMAAAPLSG